MAIVKVGDQSSAGPHDVVRFADSAERTTQMPSPAVNQLTMLDNAAGKVQYWTGSAWADVGGAREYFYGQITAQATIAATADATPQEVISGTAITYDGSPVWVEFFAPQAVSATGADLRIALWDATTSAGFVGVVGAGGVGGQTCTPVYCKRRITPTAASHTYRICASGQGTPYIVAGTGVGVGSFPPAFLRITSA